METTAFNKQLSKLTEGLFYMSESDYPFEIIDFKGSVLDEIKNEIIALHAPETHMESVNSDDFFNKLIEGYLSSGDELLISMAKSYDKLYSFISNHASEVNVIRCGRIEVGIYIIIFLKKGEVTALKTTSIET